MNFVYRVLVFFLAAAFLSSYSLAKAKPEMIEERDWIKLSLAGMDLITDANKECALKLFGDFESFKRVAQMVTGVNLSQTVRPFKVFALKKNRHFKSLTKGMISSSNVIGLHFENVEGNFSIVDIDSCRGSVSAREVLFHEYVHYLASQSGGAMPYWYSEGLADYFSTVSFENKGLAINLGKLKNGHVLSFTHYGLRFMPSEELLKIRRRPKTKKDAWRLYAQGWLITHYMLSNESTRVGLIKYLGYINSGLNEDASFSKSFDFTYKELDNELRSYVNRKSYKYKKIVINRNDLLRDILVTKISHSDVLTEVGNMLAAKGFGFDRVSPYFKHSLVLNSDNLKSKAALALLVSRERPKRAMELIDEVFDSNIDDPWIYTAKGKIYSEMSRLVGVGDIDSQASVDFANESLRAFKVGLQQSANISAMIGVGDIYFRQGYVEKAVIVFEAAESYAPANDAVCKNLILAYYASGDVDGAKRVVDRYRNKHHRSEKSIEEFNEWVKRVSSKFEVKVNRKVELNL